MNSDTNTSYLLRDRGSPVRRTPSPFKSSLERQPLRESPKRASTTIGDSTQLLCQLADARDQIKRLQNEVTNLKVEVQARDILNNELNNENLKLKANSQFPIQRDY